MSSRDNGRFQEMDWDSQRILLVMCVKEAIRLQRKLRAVAGVVVATRIASEGRRIARASGVPSDYLDHLTAELAAHI